MEPFTVNKFIRGNVPEWYVRRCLDAVGGIVGDHYLGRRPFTLMLVGADLRNIGSGWVAGFTFQEFRSLEPMPGVTPIGDVLIDAHDRVPLRRLGLV